MRALITVEDRDVTRAVRLALVFFVVGMLLPMPDLSVGCSRALAYVKNVRSSVLHRQTCRHLPTTRDGTYFHARNKAIDAGCRP